MERGQPLLLPHSEEIIVEIGLDRRKHFVRNAEFCELRLHNLAAFMVLWKRDNVHCLHRLHLRKKVFGAKTDALYSEQTK